MRGGPGTLRDAADHVMALPKAESALPHWQLAVECLMAAAEKRGIVMMARIAVVKALTHGEPVEPPAPRRSSFRLSKLVLHFLLMAFWQLFLPTRSRSCWAKRAALNSFSKLTPVCSTQ